MMKNIQIEVKWAIIFSLMGLLWIWMEKLVGLHSQYIDKHPIYTNLIAIPAIAIYVFALLDKRKHFFAGKMNFQQGFSTGMIITLIVALLSPLSQVMSTVVITPEYFPNVIEYVVKKSLMTRAQAESYFSLNNYIIQSLIGALVMGTITSAVVALVVRSKKSANA